MTSLEWLRGHRLEKEMSEIAELAEFDDHTAAKKRVEASRGLADMIRDLTMRDFEAIRDGNIHIYSAPDKELIKFSLRVGIHFGTAKKAVIAKGHFVKMARAAEYDPYDKWLYKFDMTKSPDIYLSNGEWNPLPHLQYTQQMQYVQYPTQYQTYPNQVYQTQWVNATSSVPLQTIGTWQGITTAVPTVSWPGVQYQQVGQNYSPTGQLPPVSTNTTVAQSTSDWWKFWQSGS